MAVNTVSSTDQEIWQLVATTTATSGSSSVTIASGLAGYKRYMLVISGLTFAASANAYLRFNGAGSGYGSSVAGGGTSTGRSDGIVLLYGATTSAGTGYVLINNANNTTIPKTTESHGDNNWWSGYGIWNSTAEINSIQIITTTSTISAATFTLYGIAG